MKSMTFKRLIFPIALAVLAALALYLLIVYQFLLDPSRVEPIAREATANTVSEPEQKAPPTSDLPTRLQLSEEDSNQQTGSRLIEIFGRVTDQTGQPIEDVLVTEERYFISTRSDTDGQYKLLLDLPVHRYPGLNFLRNGFAGQRFKLSEKKMRQKSVYELSPVLTSDPNSIRLSGWVSNDLGAALGGARIDLSALQPGDHNNYYLTVFSEASGNFVLEGVPAGKKYKLTVNLVPQYPVYRDHDFLVGNNPQLLNIELKSLRFVDIDGMILNQDAAPVPNFKIQVNNITTGTHSRTIVSDSSGFFSLRNFPLGEISLSTRGSEFYKITGLVLTDTSYQNLVLTVDRGNRYLSGWVRDASGQVPQRAMVTLDKTDHDGPLEYHQYRSQATDGNGRFSFENLGSGEYRVTVYAEGYQKLELAHRIRNQSDEIQITLKRP
ncbi:MAG: carboxypeptidase regulatory-like domain-containing protein [Gammaproteobacteria bacterium]|nr:carboxypeptidase regulatory-like domain-containing protein [Gammaproteobacteria bacterium]